MRIPYYISWNLMLTIIVASKLVVTQGAARSEENGVG